MRRLLLYPCLLLPHLLFSAGPLIKNVPHVRQAPDFCGEACIEMYLRHLGHELSQEDIHALSPSKLNSEVGFHTPDMALVLNELGFDLGTISHYIRPRHSEVEVQEQWDQLHIDLIRGIPSIVCMNLSKQVSGLEHFRLILGYDVDSDEVIYHEPGEDEGAYHRIPLKRFLDLWPLRVNRREWRVIRMPLKTKRALKIPDEASLKQTRKVRTYMSKLKEGLAGYFSVRYEKPFIVLGNDGERKLREHSTRIIRWFCDQVEAEYFDKPPHEIHEIWLFKDQKSYDFHNHYVFSYGCDTPYGFYIPADARVVMNIATGGGTLCHEIIHTYMPANFPECPAWFNEGLGSLYEAVGRRNGKLYGKLNWRLPYLQLTIQAGSLPSLETLMNTTERQFYSGNVGLHYAYARYVLYYLQERGLLKDYWEAFRKNAKEDPGGIKTLEKITGRNLQDFQKSWELWILTLKYER